MKEYLHLFEDVKNALPEEHSDKTIIDINHVEGRAFYVSEVYWIGTREFFPSWVQEDPESEQCYLEKGWYYCVQDDGETQYYPIEVLYWLNLDDLTTKKKAIEALENLELNEDSFRTIPSADCVITDQAKYIFASEL